MRNELVTAWTLALLTTVACNRSPSSDNASSTAAPATSATAAPAASASARAPDKAGKRDNHDTHDKAGPAGAYQGAYTLKHATVHVPDGKEWDGVKWRGDDAGVAIGDGAISLTIAADGRVHGSVEGPAGQAAILGRAIDGALSATVTSAPTTEEDFDGTLVGKLVGDKINGTLRLSSWNASLIREATFSATKK